MPVSEPIPVPTVVLDKHFHNQRIVVSIQFERYPALEAKVQNELEALWSQTRKFWYLDFTQDNINMIIDTLKPYARIDQSLLIKKNAEFRNNFHGYNLSPETQNTLAKFKRWLTAKRYSPATVNTYCSIMVFFLKYIDKINCQHITSRTVEQFNYEFIVAPKKSISYQNQTINAIKQYLEYIHQEI